MKLATLFSGGKDSVYSAYKTSQKQKNEVVCLITMLSKNKESYMFHTPNIEWVDLQAEAMELPILKNSTEGKKEEELKDLKHLIKKAKEEFGIDGVTTGAVASEYQSNRIKNICKDLEIECINPLWKIDQIQLLNELVDNNFEVVIGAVAGYPLDESFLGKIIDEKIISKLQELHEEFKLHPAGEGGEIETFVTNGPNFKRGIKILEAEKRFKNHSGVYNIKEAVLE